MKETCIVIFMNYCLGGEFLGMFVGMFKARRIPQNYIRCKKALMPWISAICLLIGFISMFLTFNFLKKSKIFLSLYQEEIWRYLWNLLCANVSESWVWNHCFYNIRCSAIPLAIFIIKRGDFILHKPSKTFFLTFFHYVVLSRSKKTLLNHCDCSSVWFGIFRYTKGCLEHYINSYDEGERQANLEQSFRILFQLHQYVLPAIYFS